MGFLKTFVDDVRNLFKKEKVVSYCFAVKSETNDPVLGVKTVIKFKDQCVIPFKPVHIVTNIPCAGLFFIEDIKISNQNCNIGMGVIDAYSLHDIKLELPSIYPGTNFTIIGKWTNKVPHGYELNESFPLAIAVIGTEIR